MNCVTISDIQQVIFHRHAARSIYDLIRHTKSCAKCKKLFDQYTNLRTWLVKYESQQLSHPESASCYSGDQLLEYLENRTRPADFDKIQQHLAECSFCLNELVQIQKFLEEYSQVKTFLAPGLEETGIITRLVKFIGQSISWPLKGLRLLKPSFRYAVVLVSVFLIVTSIAVYYSYTDQAMITRDPLPPETVTDIQLIYPKMYDRVESQDIRFAWQGTADVTYYNFIFLNENGDILLEKQLQQTEQILPENITLQPGMNYFWQIEAHMAGGKIILSEMVRFTYMPD
jgi:hypothetical protein